MSLEDPEAWDAADDLRRQREDEAARRERWAYIQAAIDAAAAELEAAVEAAVGCEIDEDEDETVKTPTLTDAQLLELPR